MSDAQYRIGEVAEAAGVSTRTLRYYEELGLVSPSGHSPGGARRYSDADLARVLRIRELQHLVGFNLEAIEINNQLREDMKAKLSRLETFLADLDARAALYRRRARAAKRS
jgi:DNA-binding transcriptional MerR regulator